VCDFDDITNPDRLVEDGDADVLAEFKGMNGPTDFTGEA